MSFRKIKAQLRAKALVAWDIVLGIGHRPYGILRVGLQGGAVAEHEFWTPAAAAAHVVRHNKFWKPEVYIRHRGHGGSFGKVTFHQTVKGTRCVMPPDIRKRLGNLNVK